MDSVIGQMDLRLKVVDVEGVGGSSHIALVVPICPHNSIEIRNEYIVPYIEFSVVVEQRSIDVHLHNEGSR